MTPQLASSRLAELGNLTRLETYRLLVRAGRNGLTISEVRDRIDVPLSTLSFHIRGLVTAGLVEQEKIGRVVFCRATYSALDELIAFLTDECCAGVPELSEAPCTRRAAA